MVIPYFNFSNSIYREAALVRTVAALGRDVEILLVAHNLATTARQHLSRSDNVRVLDVPSAARVWQKERFLNLALSSLPAEARYMVWIDADIVFADDSWQTELRRALETHTLVQVFSAVADLYLDGAPDSPAKDEKQSTVRAFHNGTLDATYFARSGVSQSLGCAPGFAWAARVETMTAVRFPDFLILGSGDKALLAAALGHHEAYCRALSLNEHLGRQYVTWGRVAFESIRGSVAYVNHTIYHILQGDYRNRRYSNRYQLLADDEFTIKHYLDHNAHGAWQWKHDNEYAARLVDYFEQRGD